MTYDQCYRKRGSNNITESVSLRESSLLLTCANVPSVAVGAIYECTQLLRNGSGDSAYGSTVVETAPRAVSNSFSVVNITSHCISHLIFISVYLYLTISRKSIYLIYPVDLLKRAHLKRLRQQSSPSLVAATTIPSSRDGSIQNISSSSLK